MPKQAQLPPRCPVQKKNTNTSSFKDIGEEQHKSISTLDDEQQPEWLNDLLSDSDSNSSAALHRRAASDSLTFFDGLVPLSGLDQHNDDTEAALDDGLESRCNYGPNSPRTRNQTGFPEKEIVSAFSEYMTQNVVLHHLDGPISVSQSDACAPEDATKAMKRHPGQRSRVRKLQYIAELERTVHILQNLASELSVRVESLLQQNVAMSMENSSLKQQLLMTQQEKFILDGEYQSLMKELDMLKSGLAFPTNKKLNNWSLSTANLWEMPDIGKLNLN